MVRPQRIDEDPGCSQLGDTAKEGRKAPELILTPRLERVVVTLRAIDPPPHEYPNQLGHQNFGRHPFRNVVKVARGRAVTLTSDALDGDLAERLVHCNAVQDPVFESFHLEGVVRSHESGAKQIAETESPVFGEFR